MMEKPRVKSSRKFGRDITNCYQPNVQQLCPIAHQLGNKNITRMEEEEVEGCSRGIDNRNCPHPSREALSDHIDEIMMYTISQSICNSIQEDYLSWHKQIDEGMRSILVTWIIGVNRQFKLKQQTLFLALSLIDKYCYRRLIYKRKYQLLGITSLFIAAKYEELYTPKLTNFQAMCEGIYTKNDILAMEFEILETMEYEISGNVLVREIMLTRVQSILKEDEDNSFLQNWSEFAEEPKLSPLKSNTEGQSSATQQLVAKFCEYILELTAVEYKFCFLNPNYLSAVILYIACKLKNVKGKNSKYLMEKYELNELIFKEHFYEVNSLFKRRKNCKFKEVNKKYGVEEENKNELL